jgi:hypothetical protein
MSISRAFRIQGLRLTTLALVAIAFLAAGHAAAQEAALPPPLWAKEAAYLQADLEKREAWEKAWERLMRFRAESKDAIEEQIKLHLDPVIDDAKAKAPAFAEEVLGLEGKLHHAAGLVEKFVSDTVYGIGNLFGSTQMYEPKNWSGGIERFARERFPRMVLDRPDVERAVNAAVSGYLARLKELENGVLVDLAADLPDGALGPDPSHPDMIELIRLASDPEYLASTLSDDANADAAGFAFRWVVGDKVADKLTEDQPDGMKKSATKFAVSNQVENGLNAGMKAIGFDPAASLTAKVREHLDDTRSLLCGKDDPTEAFDQLYLIHLTHPDADVRTAAGEAVNAFERHKYRHPGLRPRLRAAFYQRNIALRKAIFQHIIEADAPTESFLIVKGDLPCEALLLWATEWKLFLDDFPAWSKMKEQK